MITSVSLRLAQILGVHLDGLVGDDGPAFKTSSMVGTRTITGAVAALSYGGAAGCQSMAVPVRRGVMVFMTQRMPWSANLSL